MKTGVGETVVNLHQTAPALYVGAQGEQKLGRGTAALLPADEPEEEERCSSDEDVPRMLWLDAFDS
jgi:hypothetical protein